MTQGFHPLQATMQAAEALLSGEAATPVAETQWSSAQVFRFKTREDSASIQVNGNGRLPIWQVMQQLSREIGHGGNQKDRQSTGDEPLAERWKLQSEGLSSQVASLRAQLGEARRNQDCLRNDLYDSMKREASLKAKLAAAQSRADAVERWAQVLGQGMEDEVSRNFLESDKKQLQNLTECLALAVKSMTLFVGLMDRDAAGGLRYTFVHNQKQFFGDAEMIGKQDDEIIPASIPGVREGMAIKQKALDTGVTATGEITLVLPDNCTHWMLTCEPRRGKRNEVVGVAVAAVNITETVEGRARLAKLHSEIAARDATEAELRKAIHLTEEAVKTKSMFLAIMSHEMRTPLNGVLGMAHVLRTTPLDDEQRELVDAMLASGDTLLAIVDDAVDVRKLEAGEVTQHSQPFNPHQIVKQVLHMASAAIRSKAISFEANVGPDVPTTMVGDELRIRQVLTNLVHNALKFTNSGYIRISISVSDDSPVEAQRPIPETPKRSSSQSALSGMDTGGISDVTIAGGDGLSQNPRVRSGEEATSSGRRGFGRQGFRLSDLDLTEVDEEDESQPLIQTPSSVLDMSPQELHGRCETEEGENEAPPCEHCGAVSGIEGTRSGSGSMDERMGVEEGSSERDGFQQLAGRPGGLHRSLRAERSLDKQGSLDANRSLDKQGSLDANRSLRADRLLDKQGSLDADRSGTRTPERMGRGIERLQRTESRSSSGGRQRSPRLLQRDVIGRPAGPQVQPLQRENSLASISEGILDFEEALERIEAEREQGTGSVLSRESSLDSNPGGRLQESETTPDPPVALDRTQSLSRQASLTYVTERFVSEALDGPKAQSLGRSASAMPEKGEGFGNLDERRTASEHAFKRISSFGESTTEPPVWLQVSVQDSGCGIPEEAFPMLFEKFTQVDASTTRQYGGTGLGLAICKQLVENILCGKMDVESRLDIGSTFKFTVPCQKASTETPTTPQEECACPFGTWMQFNRSSDEQRAETSADAPKDGSRSPEGMGEWRGDPLEVSADVAGDVAVDVGPSVELVSDEMVWQKQSPCGANPDSVNRSPSQGAASAPKPPPLNVAALDSEAHGPLSNSPSSSVVTSPGARSASGHSPRRNNSLNSPRSPKPSSPRTPRASTAEPKVPPPSRTCSDSFFPRQKCVRQSVPAVALESPPLSPNPPTSPLPEPPPSDSRPSLLLVEDNSINVVVAQSMLKRLGLRADTAANGVEAVFALSRKKYHMVMMDICMPRMDGLQATSAVRQFEATGEWRFDVADDELDRMQKSPSEQTLGCQQGVHVPIVAMTANALEMDVNRCYSHGLDAFIAKPVSFAKLRSVLEHFLPWYKLELKGGKS